jgi:hypothetical protein
VTDELAIFREKTERNARVQARYDALMLEGKRGHYETMFRVVREEVEREREECAAKFEVAADIWMKDDPAASVRLLNLVTQLRIRR